MHFGFMNIILLHINHRHVSATHMAIFRVVSARIQIYSTYGMSGSLHSQSHIVLQSLLLFVDGHKIIAVSMGSYSCALCKIWSAYADFELFNLI